jgi:hypothetical protein
VIRERSSTPVAGPGSTRPFLLRRLAPLAAVLWLGTAACSSAAATGTQHTTTTTTTTSTNASVTVTTVGVAGYVTIDGKKVAIPDEGTKPIQPIEDVGEQIIITPKAIEPHLLFCQVKYRLTFTNLTSVTQQLTFTNDGGWHSPKIVPGGTWHFTPHYGISYQIVTNTHLEADFHASVPLPGNP